MRKMLQSKAGGTFCMDCPDFTYVVRKDVVEIVFKVKPGVYLVVNFARVEGSRGMLFVGWGRFWDRLTNEKLQMPRIQKCCPVLYGIMTGEDKEGINEMSFGVSAEEADHGFGLEVVVPENLPLLLCLNASVLNKALSMRKKMLLVYNELVKNPPFPAWKEGIGEIWE